MQSFCLRRDGADQHLSTATSRHFEGERPSDACRNHDECYGTSGSNKGVCDSNLEDDMSDQCSWCGPVGDVYGTAVDWFGDGAYSDAQSDACSCR
jgi:hypothetical protein